MTATRWVRTQSRRTIVLLVAGGLVATLAGVWLLVAVLVPSAEDLPCSGVEFRAPVQTTPSAASGVPPVGGAGGFAGRVRSMFIGGAPVVYCHDFADPFVLRTGSRYYAYSTNTEDDHVPALTSGGLFGTATRADALPKLPAWSGPGYVWAPALLARPGGYVLYYTTLDRSTGTECISYALGTKPTGRFVDATTGPLVCPRAVVRSTPTRSSTRTGSSTCSGRTTTASPASWASSSRPTAAAWSALRRRC